MAGRAHVAQQVLRDETRILHARRGGVDEPRNDDLVALEVALLHRHLKALHISAVTRIGALQQQVLGLHLPKQRPHMLRRDILVMRPCIVSPADVDTHLLHWNLLQRPVQGLHVASCHVQKLCLAEIRPLGVAAHAQVGTVHLKEETLLGNLLIFLGESISQRHDVGPVVVEDEITAEERHRSRGGHRVEAIRNVLACCLHCCQE
mmetsp:Transcript_24472/g.50832  ORF Transcript_24472/g.50832 Transcript_24472/m.50832 type:complete len:205 (-) Transcript_24472:887-1501(-)